MGKEIKTEQELLEEATGWIMRLENAPAGSPVNAGFEAWLSACEEHRVAWARVNETWRMLGAIKPAYNQNVWGNVPSEPKPPIDPVSGVVTRAPPARKLYRRYGVTSVVALAAACILWFVAPVAYISLQADHRTAAGQSELIQMADGSTVELGGSSAIKADIGATQRRVTLLAGEAFFDVASDTSRPFIVDVAGLEVKVLGTAFDVQVSSSSTSVALLRGSVMVGPTTERGGHFSLKPGELLSIDHATGKVSVTTVSPDDIGAWRGGKVFLADATVASVVEMIQRYHSAWISIPDRGLASRKVSGLFDLRNPDQALSALVEPFGGTVRSVTPLARVISRL